MADIMKYIVDEQLAETDPHGFLLNLKDWNEQVAQQLAREEDIELSDAHWEIIHFLRDYYSEFGLAPNVRLLMKSISKKLGADKGNRKYLYGLFPNGPSRQGCRIAGLPKPNDCIDWPG